MAGTSGDMILESQNYGTSTDTEDTLDFSLFGQSVNIDMGLTDTRQEVASWTEGTETVSLWVTLKGLFSNLIGSSEDDTLRGNDLVNNIEGRDGNDKIGGGGGVDNIYGGDKTDALNSYDVTDGIDTDLDAHSYPGGVSHEDNWYSIERPRKGALPAPNPDIGDIGLIPVTGGQLVQLPCDPECITLQLEDGSYAEFCNLCDYWAAISQEYTETIPYDMPKAGSLVMGTTIVLMDPESNLLDEVPEDATLKVGYPMTGKEATNLHIHLYELIKEAWAELPSAEAIGFLEAYTDFPGTFVMVE
jgi:hypothetical protein